MRKSAIEYKKSRDRLNGSIDRFKRELSRVKPRASRKRSFISLKLARNIRIIKSYSSKQKDLSEDLLEI